MSFSDTLTAIEHAIATLVGWATVAQKDIATIEASDPVVAAAIKAGEAYATAQGLPVVAIAAGAEEVLTLAQQVVAATGAGTTAPAAP